MPRKSPFDMNLSSEERQTLESMARKYTSPYCDVIRAKIILLADEGFSNDVISSRLDQWSYLVALAQYRCPSPWQHRSWIFPRDPNFATKAGPILDLYHRVW